MSVKLHVSKTRCKGITLRVLISLIIKFLKIKQWFEANLVSHENRLTKN